MIYELACPLCSSADVVVDQLVIELRLLGLDPVTGEMSTGAVLETRPHDEVLRFYLCRPCGYTNIDRSMFIRKVAA